MASEIEDDFRPQDLRNGNVRARLDAFEGPRKEIQEE